MTRRLEQSHLTVFLSGLCNLGCRYCYVKNMRGEVSDERKLLRGIEFFLRRTSGPRKITFLGGEPLLQRRLLRRAVLRARRLDGRVPVCVFTNGTLLDRGWLSFFKRQKVKMTLSLDGGKTNNDASRRFPSGKVSVHDAVLERLPPGDRAGVTVAMVVTPRTAASLPGSIDHLVSSGFRSIAWAPDITARWSGRDIAALGRAVLKVKLRYFRSIKKGVPPYEIANIYETLREALAPGPAPVCSNLTLGPDGDFYPCDKLLAVPAESRKTFVMKLRGGRLDLSGRKRFFAAAARDGALPGAGSCDIGPWVLTHDRAGAGGLNNGHAELGRLVSGWLGSMAKAGLNLAAFRQAHPAAPGPSRKGMIT